MSSERLYDARVLIYSHDSFGLGHLRRCRAIAHALVDRFKGLSVLILSGSPIIGSFDFRARVDFVRVPGVIKLRNGEYTSLGLHIDVNQTLAMRASIIEHTADAFDPHLFLVDKEPLGLEGEVRHTLARLKQKGTVNVLGLRDVMDDPLALSLEWRRKQAIPALHELYDDIWVYGPREFNDPLAGLELGADVREKMLYTGFLPRSLPSSVARLQQIPFDEPYLLVTGGGGGDGADMLDWVLRAYESGASLPHPALLVFGPFMAPELQQEFLHRCDQLDRVTAISFDTHFESLMEHAAAVVAMGGYNTFCEILSFDKPAVLVPRTRPRREQLIRARRAEQLGLTRMLDVDAMHDTGAMIDALRALSTQPAPSAAGLRGLMDGLEVIAGKVQQHIDVSLIENYELFGASG